MGMWSRWTDHPYTADGNTGAGNTDGLCVYIRCVSATQPRPTLCLSVDCSPPGSSVHGILQARILEWVAIPFSRGSSQPRDQTQVSSIAG